MTMWMELATEGPYSCSSGWFVLMQYVYIRVSSREHYSKTSEVLLPQLIKPLVANYYEQLIKVCIPQDFWVNKMESILLTAKVNFE